MTEARHWDVVVIGGGAGGLVLALQLAKKGFRIAVLDRQPSLNALLRGEIVQPNGLKILDQLGLLPDLLHSDVYLNRKVHFYQAASPHLLCTVNYQALPDPYSYSLILLPGVIQRLLLQKAAALSNIEIFWGTAFHALIWEDRKVVGVEMDCAGQKKVFRAPLVVGGDGVRSAVREAFRIQYQLHSYVDGYLTAVVDRPPGFHEESHYYLGKGEIFGAFPVSRERLYLFYMIPSLRLDRFQAEGLDPFKNRLLSLNPEVRSFLEAPLKGLSSWEEISFMRCFRVRCQSWVVNGGALIGDAAHAMNPHVAQGRNSAMEDGMALAEVIEDCFHRGDFSRRALLAYEAHRRPKVDLLQRLGDEMTWLWNSGWPPLIWARDRIFRNIHHHPALHDKILATIAGLKIQPFNLADRWTALLKSPTDARKSGSIPDRGPKGRD